MATKRTLTEETKAVLAARQAQFTSIANNPAWPELVAEVDRKVERLQKALVARALGGGDQAPEFPQREADYMRGFINGMRWLLAVPSGAEARLEHYLQDQERKARVQQRSEQ